LVSKNVKEVLCVEGLIVHNQLGLNSQQVAKLFADLKLLEIIYRVDKRKTSKVKT
jgi:hypothetical protein